MSEETRIIVVAGDLAPLGRPAKWLGAGEKNRVFGQTLSAIQDADLFVCNLECPLTESAEKYSKAGPNLKADSQVAAGLSLADVTVCSLANNHMFDYGLIGVTDTIEHLTKQGILWTGVGETAEKAGKPLVVDIAGIKTGLLSFAEHEFNWQSDSQWCTAMLEPAMNVLQIQQTAQQCDVLIVLLHSGPENWHYPSPAMVKTCRAFAESGASAVLVSHSHAVMGMEIHKGVPIVYGLGNFLFDKGSNVSIGWRLGLMAQVTLRREAPAGIEIVPVLMNPDTGSIDLLNEPARQQFDAFYEYICQPLNSMDTIEDYWKAFCASQAAHLTRETFKALAAMVPGALANRLLPKNKRIGSQTYYCKGANILRGLTVCENHQSVIGQIFDLIRVQRFTEYLKAAEELKDPADRFFDNQ